MNLKLKSSFTFLFYFVVGVGLSFGQDALPDFEAKIKLKVPGNPAVVYPLNEIAEGSLGESKSGKQTVRLISDSDLPLSILRTVQYDFVEVELKAREDLYFNFKQWIRTGYPQEDCQFYMPGFWYRRNLRSPKEAPSFHTSESWTVREDRLSTPMTAVFNEKSGDYFSIMRVDAFRDEALTTHKEGEVILSGKTSLGYTGFENDNQFSNIAFGYPYQETPKSYLRKLTLAPAVEAFQYLRKGETVRLKWRFKKGHAADFSDLVRQLWEYSYDVWNPQPVKTPYDDAFVKKTLSRFFTQSLVTEHPLKFNSGEAMEVATCNSVGRAEVGFVGRVLLNAFNALEYGEKHKMPELAANSHEVFDSYLREGFTPNGLLREFVNFDNHSETTVYSIRRQSEGLSALLHFLRYEKDKGNKHPEWEQKVRTLLDKLTSLQNADGSFPRKFKDDFTVVDTSGGSTPSATLPLVMGYRYFKDKTYLKAAQQTAVYLEKEIISKADYFSSTLDANCEDKEASLYASTAMYYLALISKGKEQQHYADLSRDAAYFALSWYYLWDVPFARGQMIGDIGLKTRGWGNVSVENNHIDVFVFEFGSVLEWLSRRFDEPRFGEFVKVISSSMRQLLPFEGHLCGVAKPGYYPEVVQHTNWDYGKNGKGFYNDIFAPGWTVASLWELLTPGRAENFLLK